MRQAEEKNSEHKTEKREINNQLKESQMLLNAVTDKNKKPNGTLAFYKSSYEELTEKIGNKDTEIMKIKNEFLELKRKLSNSEIKYSYMLKVAEEKNNDINKILNKKNEEIIALN